MIDRFVGEFISWSSGGLVNSLSHVERPGSNKAPAVVLPFKIDGRDQEYICMYTYIYTLNPERLESRGEKLKLRGGDATARHVNNQKRRDESDVTGATSPNEEYARAFQVTRHGNSTTAVGGRRWPGDDTRCCFFVIFKRAPIRTSHRRPVAERGTCK